MRRADMFQRLLLHGRCLRQHVRTSFQPPPPPCFLSSVTTWPDNISYGERFTGSSTPSNLILCILPLFILTKPPESRDVGISHPWVLVGPWSSTLLFKPTEKDTEFQIFLVGVIACLTRGGNHVKRSLNPPFDVLVLLIFVFAALLFQISY